MTLAKTLDRYNDVRRVLDTALANDGSITFKPDNSTAAHWRRRAYHYRTLFVRHMATSSTPYDDLVFEVVGDKIHITTTKVGGTIYSSDGKVLEVVDKDPGAPKPDYTREVEDANILKITYEMAERAKEGKIF